MLPAGRRPRPRRTRPAGRVPRLPLRGGAGRGPPRRVRPGRGKEQAPPDGYDPGQVAADDTRLSLAFDRAWARALIAEAAGRQAEDAERAGEAARRSGRAAAAAVPRRPADPRDRPPPRLRPRRGPPRVRPRPPGVPGRPGRGRRLPPPRHAGRGRAGLRRAFWPFWNNSGKKSGGKPRPVWTWIGHSPTTVQWIVRPRDRTEEPTMPEPT